MGAKENEATLIRAFEAFNQGNIDRVLSICAEDTVWTDNSPAASGIRGTYNGVDELRALFAKVDEVIEITKFDVTRILAEDDFAMVLVAQDGNVKSTGKSIQGNMVHVFEFNADGKVSRWEGFASEPESVYVD